MNLLELLHATIPEGWVESAAAIIVSVLSWYLGRQRERRQHGKKRRIDD